MASGPIQRIVLSIGITRALSAPVRITRSANLVCHPYAALTVHHRVMRIAGVVPDQFVSPVHRRFEIAQVDIGSEIPFTGLVAHRHLDVVRLIGGGIDPHQFVAGESHTVDGPVGINAAGRACRWRLRHGYSRSDHPIPTWSVRYCAPGPGGVAASVALRHP